MFDLWAAVSLFPVSCQPVTVTWMWSHDTEIKLKIHFSFCEKLQFDFYLQFLFQMKRSEKEKSMVWSFEASHHRRVNKPGNKKMRCWIFLTKMQLNGLRNQMWVKTVTTLWFCWVVGQVTEISWFIDLRPHTGRTVCPTADREGGGHIWVTAAVYNYTPMNVTKYIYSST